MLNVNKNNSKILGKILLVIFTLCLILPSSAFAEEAKLSLTQIGYGETYQSVLLQFSNVGNLTISDITIYIDGKVNKTFQTILSKGKSIPFDLYLSTGKHTIEARTPEGAYTSLDVTAVAGKVLAPEVPQETNTEEAPPSISDAISKNMLTIILLIAIAIFLVSLWLLTKRRRAKR